MKNEFGVALDRNGYAPSIVTFDMDCCFLCDARDEKLDRHECFGGAQRGTSQTGAQRAQEPLRTNPAAADIQQEEFAVIDDSGDLLF